ncbi:hypothetical protein K1X76_06750 [bacterium]|nr:hypothetical protein [bacterium]
MKKIMIALFLLIPFYAHSALPPLTDKQLDSLSNTVVKATVTSNKVAGPTQEIGCTKRTLYTLTLKVSDTIKGKAPTTQTITYTGIELKEMCTGPSVGLHLQGETGIFYLKCDEKECGIIDVRDNP